MALGAQPPLTSIDMRLEKVGRVAADCCWPLSRVNPRAASGPFPAIWW